MNGANLALYEEILLLALDDRKGTSALGSMHDHAMGGAILAELLLAGALFMDDEKKKLVTAVPHAEHDDPLLQECLAKVQAAKRRRKAADWVMKFAGLKSLKNRVARGLVLKGVLKEERDKVLGIFPRTTFPERNPGPERALIARLRSAVLTDDEVDERTLVVAVIARAAGLLERAVPKKELKPRKARLKAMAEGHVAGKATGEAIEAVQAAVIAATAAASIAATTAATAGS